MWTQNKLVVEPPIDRQIGSFPQGSLGENSPQKKVSWNHQPTQIKEVCLVQMGFTSKIGGGFLASSH